MKVFLDTMVYLHYRSVDKLNFTEIFGPSPHTVIMPRITLRELDKHKNTHSSNKVRKRARQLLKNIERWAKGEEIQEGVSMEFLQGMPVVDYESLGLNPDWADDILLASIFHYRTSHANNADSILVTQDTGPRITATQLGIGVMKLTENYKLSTDPDPLEKENRELRQTISTLQNALPKLEVSFSGSEQSVHHATFTLTTQPESKEQEIKRKINDLKIKLPEKLPPEPASPDSKTPASRKKNRISNLIIPDPIPAEEYERYNRGVREYLLNYERYLRNTWELQAAIKRSIRFRIEIRNGGTAPADDVDIHFHFPDGFRLFTHDDRPDFPKEPRPPQEPRTTMQMISASMNLMPHLNITQPSVPEFKMPGSFNIERTKSYDVRDHFTRIKHGDKALLPELILTFDSFEEALPFSCDYTIMPANLPAAITGKLHFKIEKKNVNEDLDTEET